MIELFGPTYRYDGEILTEPEIIVINDHHYDELNHCYHVQQVLENSTCDPHEHMIVMDSMSHDDQLHPYQCVCLPINIAGQSEQFIKQQLSIDWSNKTHVFNIMINKPRPHREFLLLLIKHFGLTSYTHALPWRRININRNGLKRATNNSLYHDIIDSTKIDIATTNYAFGTESVLDQGIQNGQYKNSEVYQHLLQKTVFEPSCVSLITEPAFYERETIHTEKTIMAMYAGTIPIWVGGWRLPAYTKSLGFDIFDDIVDHSYQDLPDPLDRCYCAIERNLELLRDPDRAKTFVAQNHARLQHNLNLLTQNVFLTHCFDKINSYPEPTRSALFCVAPKQRGNTVEEYRSRSDYRLLGS
jgi:hypothetical protein